MTNWISVLDELPERNIPVMCYNFPEKCKCWLCDDGKFHAFFGGRRLHGVTHWIDLYDYQFEPVDAK